MSETETPTPEATAEELPAETDVTPDADGAEALGDAGKKALDSMKSKWHTERDKRRDLENELAELRAAAKPADQAPDLDEIKRQATREATQAANARVLRSEIKAAATGKLADPADALAFLDLEQFEVSDDGSVDGEEIADAIETLLSNKPHLAAARARFQGTGDGGARKASGPSQLSRADLAGMSAEQIAAAKAEGRLRDLLSGKN